jgi:hydroxymethylbilane synthase
MRIVIGTRGSKLALAQSEWVARRLGELGAETAVSVIRTSRDSSVGRAGLRPRADPGVFVKELEGALLRGEVSLAVHSLKDLPTGSREGLALAAVPEREDPSDALVLARRSRGEGGTREGAGLSALASGARVGTGSIRRLAQLRAHRPDLAFAPVRGNVDTRLRKLEQGDLDALVLAAAGLIRLGLAARIAECLAFDICLPAPGQGALALQVRADNDAAQSLIAQLNHPPSRAAVTAERAFLEQLGGGCALPVGALAAVNGDDIVLDGVVGDPEGALLLRDRAVGSAASPEAVGRALAELMLSNGADRLVRAQC